MTSNLILHEDILFDFFEPYRHPDRQHDLWDGLGLETYGSDYEIVQKLDAAYIWTVLDSADSCDDLVVAGRHYANRSCYLITTRPHNSAWLEVHCHYPPKRVSAKDVKQQIMFAKNLIAQALLVE